MLYLITNLIFSFPRKHFSPLFDNNKNENLIPKVLVFAMVKIFMRLLSIFIIVIELSGKDKRICKVYVSRVVQ